MITFKHEARVMLPDMGFEAYIPAYHLATNRFEQSLVGHFGGYTRTNGEGGWLDANGRQVFEPVLIYDVAISAGDALELHDLAVEAAKALDQRSLYIRYPNGVVEIVDLINGPTDMVAEAA